MITLILIVLLTLAALLRWRRARRRVKGEQGRPSTGGQPALLSSAVDQRACWVLYLNDLPDPCDDGHKPFFLTAADGRITDYVCQRCTDDLPTPAWVTCPDCTYTVVSGFIAQDRCKRHDIDAAA